MSEAAQTLLVVDDNDAERYYVARVLTRAGYKVLEAANGADALALAATMPDLITLDVRLPDINGFEVCRRIKGDPATRDIPVLHISASFTTPDAKVEGLEGGADGYLVHPLDPTELVATVHALLRTRRAEALLRAAAREWTATFDLIRDPVCLTGSQGEIVRCNVAFAELVGRPFPEVIGHRLTDFVPEASLDAPGPREILIGDRHFRVNVDPGADHNGAMAARAWVFGDITERERQETALRRSEAEAQARLQEIEAVYDSAPVGLCVLDRAHRFVRINRRLAEFNGLPMAAHLGRTVRDVLPQFADLFDRKLEEVFATGRPILEMEVRGETAARPGSERIWVENWYPLTAPDGTVQAVNVVVEDVTDRRRFESQLLEAQRLEAVGRLAGGVAHETNNQMTVVLGCANFALRHPETPEGIREDVEQIRKAAERTARITAQLLAFGRRQHLRPEVVDVDAVIGRLRPILERTLGSSCELVLERHAAGRRVRADVGQLEQVLLNLTLNARDAMPAGGTLTIRTAPVDLGAAHELVRGEAAAAPGPYLLLVVSDTGEGMSEATLPRIFEPFFTTKAPGQGTGLGLSMVYGVVKQSGGQILVESVPGRGTRFEVYLPAMAEAPSPPTGERPAEDRRSSGEHVLLVEDDPLVRAIMARELAAGGYAVEEAVDGVTALELTRRRERPFDVVITDLAMPRMSGLELARALEASQPKLPVLFISGHPDHTITDEILATGWPVLQKPFTAEELFAQIDALVAGRKG